MAELNFHQLRIFAAVARLHSFSRAATELRITQPAVSSQVRQFEDDIGLVLIDRVGRRVALTDAGRTVAEYAKRLFAISDELVESVESLRDLSAGRLLMSASHTIAEYVLVPLLGRYRRTHPGIELKLDICTTRSVIDQVVNNEVDLGFVGEEVRQRGIVATACGIDTLVLVCSPSHPLAGSTITAESLASLDFVMRESGSGVRRATDRKLAEIKVMPRIVLELSTNDAVKQAVIANLGVAILSRYAVGIELDAGRLAVLPVSDLDLQRPFSMLTHRDKQLSGPERAFVDLMAV